jgi:heterodisulfide reductase subunit C
MIPTRETFGNIPDGQRWLFYALTAIAFAGFCWGVWRRGRLWTQGLDGGLKDLVSGRLASLIPRWRPGLRRLWVEALGQARVRGRGLPSVAHGLLFAGFMTLFLGTTLLEVDHLSGMVSEHLRFHHGTYYVVYELTLDLMGLAFLGGCGLFFWRRARRPGSLGHRGTDWGVLALFVGIGVTGYLVEGLRIGWQHPAGIGASCSPVGLWVSRAFAGWPELRIRSVHQGVWWFHAILVLGFIAAIPHTRLFHFIAGPLNLFLARPALGVLVPVSLEEVEQTGRVGVSDIRHLTRQQLLSLDACMECGRCEEACPAFATQKPLSPKRVVQDLRGVMKSLAKPVSEGEARVHTVVAAETLWSCTACSACTRVCPVRVDPVGLILEMRRHLVAEGGLSGTAAVALRRMQSTGNPWGFPASDRAAWMETMSKPSADASTP